MRCVGFETHAPEVERQGNNIMKDNQTVTTLSLQVMSPGELKVCLRDVRRYWSTPHITPGEIEYLEGKNLIQRAPTGLCAIRLTEQGALVQQGRKSGCD